MLTFFFLFAVVMSRISRKKQVKRSKLLGTRRAEI